MNKLKLGMAALITAIALSSCGDADSDELVAAVGNTIVKPPDGTTETTIKVTFKNGWESAASEDLVDDDYTSFKFYSGLTPSTINAVVNTEEKLKYEKAHDVWEESNKVWVQYEKDLEKAQNDGVTPPPPPVAIPLKNLILL
jgi:hypothetical protein